MKFTALDLAQAKNEYIQKAESGEDPKRERSTLNH